MKSKSAFLSDASITYAQYMRKRYALVSGLKRISGKEGVLDGVNKQLGNGFAIFRVKNGA